MPQSILLINMAWIPTFPYPQAKYLLCNHNFPVTAAFESREAKLQSGLLGPLKKYRWKKHEPFCLKDTGTLSGTGHHLKVVWKEMGLTLNCKKEEKRGLFCIPVRKPLLNPDRRPSSRVHKPGD